MKRKCSLMLSICLLLGSLSGSACDSDISGGNEDNVLYVASWDEYIDMGGSFLDPSPDGDGDYIEWFNDFTKNDKSLWVNNQPKNILDSNALYEEFEVWYKQVYGKDIHVEYVALQDNETMYNKIKMGDDHYDLLCPSEYMAMKLKDEGKLLPFPETFYQYDANNEVLKHNYYAKNVSSYTKDVFQKAGLDGYIAGYMWGTTGFVYNPKKIGNTPEDAREIMSSWYCLTSEECERKITAKDNTRDSYFMGLGMYYEEELLRLQKDSPAVFSKVVHEYMNNTDPKVMSEVKKLLEKARQNLYGLETDEGKTDVAMGRLDASYQWSGDAVFILDQAEKHGLELEYSIPKSASNLWFDGWVMMEGANVEASMAFINFLSRYDNAIRNMYYIGYTSCLAGEEIYSYIDYTYSDEKGTKTYDLSYFFGDGHILTTTEDQLHRQLFAQYPDRETTARLVVMDYFQKDENERANRMWNNIK